MVDFYLGMIFIISTFLTDLDLDLFGFFFLPFKKNVQVNEMLYT